MDVSVIIVNYNTTQLVIDCIETIYEHTKDVNFEIIVVDNNSPNRSIEKLNDIFPYVKLILNDKNSGFGAANNLGNKYAIGKYLFLLNSDTLLISNAIFDFFQFMEKTPDAGICGGNLLTKDLKPNMSFLRIKPSLIVKINELFFGLILRFIYIDNWSFAHQEQVLEINGFVSGADFFVKKALFDQVGGFDEDFFMYFEEVELTHRIEKLNYKSFILPSVKIIHLEGGSTFTENKANWQRESQKLYFQKTKQKYYKAVVVVDKLINFKKKLKNSIKR